MKNEYAIFETLCKSYGIKGVSSEHIFAKELGRKWRFDFAIIEHKIAIEIEGGVWIAGRHNRGSGFIKDMEKYNTAAMLGWRILRFTPQQINQENTYLMIKQTIEN